MGKILPVISTYRSEKGNCPQFHYLSSLLNCFYRFPFPNALEDAVEGKNQSWQNSSISRDS